MNVPGPSPRTATSPVSGPSPQVLHEQATVLGAVREDIRQTLRVGWLDPAIEAAAQNPAFFTAAWSAVRPNVGKSFLSLARVLRTEAVESVRTWFDTPPVLKGLQDELAEEEVRRIEESAKAGYLAAPKVQVVVHAMYRAARRDRIAGTGREEPPIRRGVPEWQRWMSFHPSPDDARGVLEQSAEAFGTPAPPTPLRLFARWPAALDTLWGSLGRLPGTRPWNETTVRLRRVVLAGIATLPHPVELQWTALKARGFSDDDRVLLQDVLAVWDASMAAQTLAAAAVWVLLGAPDVGVES